MIWKASIDFLLELVPVVARPLCAGLPNPDERSTEGLLFERMTAIAEHLLFMEHSKFSSLHC